MLEKLLNGCSSIQYINLFAAYVYGTLIGTFSLYLSTLNLLGCTWNHRWVNVESASNNTTQVELIAQNKHPLISLLPSYQIESFKNPLVGIVINDQLQVLFLDLFLAFVDWACGA